MKFIATIVTTTALTAATIKAAGSPAIVGVQVEGSNEEEASSKVSALVSQYWPKVFRPEYESVLESLSKSDEKAYNSVIEAMDGDNNVPEGYDREWLKKANVAGIYHYIVGDSNSGVVIDSAGNHVSVDLTHRNDKDIHLFSDLKDEDDDDDDDETVKDEEEKTATTTGKDNDDAMEAADDEGKAVVGAAGSV
ncbi:hypothetical protein EV182_004689, partial [Spiromyces aspiralis]